MRPISGNETLFRGIVRNPNFWKNKTNLPSSAAFKDSKGVSVDRDGNRNTDECIRFLNSRLDLRAVVSINAQDVIDLSLLLIPKEEEDNPYHAEIHQSEERIPLTSGQARALSKKVTVVYFDI